MQTTSRKLTVVWPLVVFLLLPSLTRAESGVQAWVQRCAGVPHAMAVDGSNNVIVTGSSAVGGGDYVTIKYSSAGVPLWTNLYNGPENANDQAYAVAVDGSNNVIVTGTSGGNYATIKYSSDGVLLWTNLYNGPGNADDQATAVAVDGSNNVIVTGSSVGSASSYDYAAIKYSSDGVPLWTNRYNGIGNGPDYAEAVAVDGSNNVIVTGASGGNYATIAYSSAGVALWTNCYSGGFGASVAVDNSNNVIVAGYSYSGYYYYATIKYSSAGVALWTNRYKGTGPNDGFDTPPHQVAVDGSNNVLVVGCLHDSLNDSDYATTKYSSAGVPLWTNCYNGGGNGIGWAYAVAVDGSNNVIVTGNSSADYATIKYSSTGVLLWANRCGSPKGWDDPCAVVVDHSGNVIVTGSSEDDNYNSYFATVKYICVPEPVVTGLQLTNGTFQIRVDDVLQPGTLVIEASTNLSTTNWAPLFTNTTPTNALFYTDPDASNAPTRFYRAFQFP
jgi:hypothetical protein